MKIAIHHRKGSYSDRWIAYCKENNIPYKVVDCFKTDIIDQLEDCDGLMWHYHHAYFKDLLHAKKLLFSLEHAGKKVYPNFHSNWHFDDKVAQKFLLESIKAPLVKSYVFYTKQGALSWASETSFPKVFKLKGGAGSKNVKLVNNFSECKRLINKAFGKGFPVVDKKSNLKERVRQFKEGKVGYAALFRAIGKFFILPEYQKRIPNEKGYIYFQDFIPGNNSDMRIIVVHDNAFGGRRMVRKGDFRASGSGNTLYEFEKLDERCASIAFKVTNKLKAQSLAFDFVFDEFNEPKIVEISYGYTMSFADPCTGYWDRNLKWHKGPFIPQEWMVENLINEIKN